MGEMLQDIEIMRTGTSTASNGCEVTLCSGVEKTRPH